MRFLAENVHRPPTTVQGWYFYNKTKNYKVMLGGLKGAGMDSLRLGLAGLGWVGAEEAADRLGYGNVKESWAGLVSAGAFSAICESTIARHGGDGDDWGYRSTAVKDDTASTGTRNGDWRCTGCTGVESKGDGSTAGSVKRTAPVGILECR
jgi:hypothetical protein